MEKLLATLMILLLPIISKSEIYQEGDTLFVAANSGLNLRTEPNLNAEKIVKIPYQKQIRILNNLESEYKERIENRDGNWIYVSYKKNKGYVFDGFLTKLRPIGNKKINEHLAPIIYYYFRNNYRQIEEQDTTFGEYGREIETKFENGITMISESGGEGGVFYEFQIDKGRLSEAINLITNLLQLEGRVKYLNSALKVEKDKNGEIVKYKADLEFNNEIEIFKKGNKLIIQTWWAC